MKKVKITKILIQVGRENSGTVLGSIHGSFIFGEIKEIWPRKFPGAPAFCGYNCRGTHGSREAHPWKPRAGGLACTCLLITGGNFYLLIRAPTVEILYIHPETVFY